MKKLDTLHIDAESEFPKIKVFVNGKQLNGKEIAALDIHLEGGNATFHITNVETKEVETTRYNVGEL